VVVERCVHFPLTNLLLAFSSALNLAQLAMHGKLQAWHTCLPAFHLYFSVACCNINLLHWTLCKLTLLYTS
jgi:hypothetical protein